MIFTPPVGMILNGKFVACQSPWVLADWLPPRLHSQTEIESALARGLNDQTAMTEYYGKERGQEKCQGSSLV